MNEIWILFGILFGIAALLYIIAFATLFFYQGKILFVPSRQLWRTPADENLPHEEIFLTTADAGRIHGWFIPRQNPLGVILYFHGNAGNISHLVEILAEFHRWGYAVLAIDYRGYGNSSGRPSEKALYRDADAAWNFLTEQKKIDPQRIVLVGRSLGSGVAAHLAARQNPAGVVLESPFISIPEVAAPMYRWFPVRQLCRHEFPNLDNVRKISCPILIAHSRDDELVPFSHGQTLFAAANEPKSFFEMTGNHNECIYASGLPYQQALQSFLRRSTAVPFE